jgi:drug/metabolite transporter (DMT)-like permease
LNATRKTATAKPTVQEKDPDLVSWLILITLSIIWGSSYILIKKSLVVYSSTEVACLRLAVSAICFLPFLLWHIRRVDWSRWRFLVLVGLTGTAIPAFMFSIAQTEISSSMAGVLNSLVPLFTLVLGVLLFGAKAPLVKLLGVLVGLAGAAMLILMGKEAGMEGNPWYGLLVIVGCICYAISSNTVGTYLRDMKALIISAASFTIVGIPAFAYLFRTDFTTKLQLEPGAWEALGYVVLLSVFGTVLASLIFFQLVQRTSPVFASMISYLVPLVAVGWGFADGETISIIHFLGMGLILSGVYLVKRKKI